MKLNPRKSNLTELVAGFLKDRQLARSGAARCYDVAVVQQEATVVFEGRFTSILPKSISRFEIWTEYGRKAELTNSRCLITYDE